MWYVHERRPAIFDGQPPSWSCRDASTLLARPWLLKGGSVFPCVTFSQFPPPFILFFWVFQPPWTLDNTQGLLCSSADGLVFSTKSTGAEREWEIWKSDDLGGPLMSFSVLGSRSCPSGEWSQQSSLLSPRKVSWAVREVRTKEARGYEGVKELMHKKWRCVNVCSNGVPL